jgi:hypothetical protein
MVTVGTILAYISRSTIGKIAARVLVGLRKFRAYNFSKDGSQVFGIFQNTSGDGALWPSILRGIFTEVQVSN